MADDAVLKKLISGAAERAVDLIQNIQEFQHTMIMLDPQHVVRAISVPSDLVEEINSNCDDDNTVNDYLRDSYASILRVHKATSYAIVTPAYFEDPDTGRTDLVVVLGAYTDSNSLTGYFPVNTDAGTHTIQPFVPDPSVEKSFNFQGLLAPITVH
ncbi:hypothetical protein IC232_03810 [Microvirga sp. BT688]|uniref:hypothetical protein n=1 Tax=Microvirga sp. TaxID=1873136 RepID=UPI0016874AF9|nr:hypothetical protein [Microvirga sp.]MBD2745817.1 hypothetical protein [Microvirga sp.]